MSEKVISTQKKIQTKNNNNNSLSSELEWYKLFVCRRNVPSQKLLQTPQPSPPPPPPPAPNIW